MSDHAEPEQRGLMLISDVIVGIKLKVHDRQFARHMMRRVSDAVLDAEQGRPRWKCTFWIRLTSE